MKISLESLMRGLRTKDDAEVGEQIAPFTGDTQPGEFNIGADYDTAELMRDYQLAGDDGISVYPTPITKGEDVEVRYRGLLSQSGADRIYLHCGFGKGGWDYVQDIPMSKRGDGSWVAKVYDIDGERFNFCFHDSAMNWDNNNGRDWSFVVHSG